jgi:hypothetical protein
MSLLHSLRSGLRANPPAGMVYRRAEEAAALVNQYGVIVADVVARNGPVSLRFPPGVAEVLFPRLF